MCIRMPWATPIMWRECRAVRRPVEMRAAVSALVAWVT